MCEDLVCKQLDDRTFDFQLSPCVHCSMIVTKRRTSSALKSMHPHVPLQIHRLHRALRILLVPPWYLWTGLCWLSMSLAWPLTSHQLLLLPHQAQTTPLLQSLCQCCPQHLHLLLWLAAHATHPRLVFMGVVMHTGQVLKDADRG